MYITNPSEIEAKSFEIVGEAMGEHNFNEKELNIVKRMIHTTGDYDYQNIVVFQNDAVRRSIEAVKAGGRIVTDTQMAYAGINKKALEKAKCSIRCYIGHEEVYTLSKEKGITRSMAAVDMAAKEGGDIFVVGNAPTALFRIGELIKENKISPKVVIGVPVGFVGAAESKEYIRKFGIPSITTRGTKGGSNVAASVVNAVLYMAVGR